MKPTRRPGLRAILLILSVLGFVVSARSSVEAQYTFSPSPCGVTVLEMNCVFIYIKPSFVAKNVHPLVTRVSMWCATKIGEPNTWVTVESGPQIPSLRDVTFTPSPGTAGASMRLGIPKSAVSPGQMFTLTCELMLTRIDANGVATKVVAVPSATAPQTPTDTNWNQVATGSVVKWTQSITFPTAIAP